MQPILGATGLLVDRTAPEQGRFIGSCFSFARSTFFLTAAHLIVGRRLESLGIAIPMDDGVDPGLRVQRAVVHPTADVAVLDLAFEPLQIFYSFHEIDHASSWGEPVQAYGYPVDNPDDAARIPGVFPTPRMFVGNIQRFFRYYDKRGNYYAAELSFPSPEGLSGGPVCRTKDRTSVVGVMAANRDAVTYRGGFERLDASGQYVPVERDVIRYGIAVSLRDIAGWINDQVSQ